MDSSNLALNKELRDSPDERKPTAQRWSSHEHKSEESQSRNNTWSRNIERNCKCTFVKAKMTQTP